MPANVDANLPGDHRESSSEEDEGAHIGDGFCSDCYGIGHSKLEQRDVPGFRRIVVRAFECEDCGKKVDEVQLAGQYDEQGGVRLRLTVPQGCKATLGRQVLKSDTATISIPELEFEIGAATYAPFAGDLTTVGEVLMAACRNLNMNQAERRAADAETAGKIDAFIQELESYAAGDHAFTFCMEDVAGNAFIAGPDGAAANDAAGDPQLQVERFARTPAQDSRMGLALPEEFLPEGQAGAAEAAAHPPASEPGRLILRVEGAAEAAAFVAAYAAGRRAAPPSGVALPTACGACGAEPGAGFEVAVHTPAEGFIPASVIVSSTCGACSAAAAEVRGTGGVAAQGCRLRLRVEAPADLERAVLQAASASIALPDLELALSSGGGSGLATTAGALISSLAQQLGNNPALAPGGGAEGAEEEAAEWRQFAASLRAFAALERPWTLELTDPLASSLVAPRAGAPPGSADAQLQVIHYQRPPAEAAEFGLGAGGGAAPIA